MFNPSAGRANSTDARDWSDVDSWLSSIYPGRQVPSFERNADTLKAILKLAAFNESAQEGRQQLHRANNQALDEVERQKEVDLPFSNPGLHLRETLLDILEHDLSNEGKAALEAIANTLVRADGVLVSPAEIGVSAIETQSALYDAEQTATRVQALESQIQRETERAQDMLQALRQRIDHTPCDLTRTNMELETSNKVLSTEVEDSHNRTAPATRGNITHPCITIDDIVREEQEYLSLLNQKRTLDEQVSVFRGLPSDPERARQELDSLQHQLDSFTSRRDAAFEGLVKRESPAKRR